MRVGGFITLFIDFRLFGLEYSLYASHTNKIATLTNSHILHHKKSLLFSFLPWRGHMFLHHHMFITSFIFICCIVLRCLNIPFDCYIFMLISWKTNLSSNILLIEYIPAFCLCMLVNYLSLKWIAYQIQDIKYLPVINLRKYIE